MVFASIDDRIVVWMATHRVEVLNDPTVWIGTIDRLGGVWVLLAVIIGIAGRAGVARTVFLAAFTALTTLAADSVSFGVKNLVDRPRPFVAHAEIHPLYVVHSSSFPAGHAATSFAGATLLSYVTPRAAPVFVVVAAAISLSRVYDGVHYPTDVLGGAGIGIVVGAVAAALLALARRRTPA